MSPRLITKSLAQSRKRERTEDGNNPPPTAGSPDLRDHLELWVGLAALLTAGQIAATLFVNHALPLTLTTDVIDFLLMLSALLVFLVHMGLSPKRAQLFWMLLAASWGVRIVAQVMWMYFDLILRKEVPNPFVGDVLLFLSNIPALAALLLQPHLAPVEIRKSRGRVDFLLLLLWWLYLYLFFVIPWQYVVPDEAKYGSNYNWLNGLLDIVLLLALGFLWRHSFGKWKWFYASYFGAQLFLTASGSLANQAIDKHLYYPGSWYDVPYAAALASFTLVGLLGLSLGSAAATSETSRAPLHVTRLGMLAVLSLPVLGAWTVLIRITPVQVTQFRELITLGTMFVMAFLVFVKQHQLRADLAKANQVLQEASLTDPLTGVRNRRFFDSAIYSDASHVLRSYAESRERRTSDLIFYMVDLDAFKEINDRYGHDVGDKILVEVTRRINSAIRTSDILIRWGGDEFLIVSRYSNREEAATFASRILTVVAAPTTVAASTAIDIRPTCSIGWAAFPWYPEEPDAIPLEAVLGLADRGVYEAKTCGKNRAIGVSPSYSGTRVLPATAGDRVSTYSVQTVCVEGPTQPVSCADSCRATAEIQAVGPRIAGW